MKAAVFDAVGAPLRVADKPVPQPAAGEVLLRVAGCGICGSDLHISHDPVPFGIAPPFVLGHEFAGEVVALGAGVETLAVGDRVAVAPMRGCGSCASCRKGEPAWCPEMYVIGGGYAEFSIVAAHQCLRVPESLPLAEAALAEPLAVGLHAVARSGIKPGDTVLILGAGPIGLVTAFWARRMGAASVIVAALNRHQEGQAMAVGATGFAISGPELEADVTAMLGGKPDIVFECVGKRGLIDFACRQVRASGKVVVVGLCIGGDDFDPFAALMKEITVIFAVFFTMAEFAVAIDALGPGQFRPQALITDRIGLSAVPAVFEALRNRTTQCKVLIDPDMR